MEPADRDRIPLASSPPPAHPRSPTPRPDEPKGRAISNLSLRWLTAALLVPPVIWVCWAGGIAYVAVVLAFILLGLNEFYGLIIAKGATPHRLLGNIAAASLPVIAYVGDASELGSTGRGGGGFGHTGR